MFDDAYDSGDSPRSSIFPFLSILFCMMGALLTIMVLGSIKTTMEDVSIPVKIAKAVSRRKGLAELTGLAGAGVASLATAGAMESELDDARVEIARANDAMGRESTGLAELRAKGAEVRVRSDKAELFRTGRAAGEAKKKLGAERVAAAERVDRTSKRRAALSDDAAKLIKRRDEFRARAGTPEARFRLGEASAGREPLYIELLEDRFVVHAADAGRSGPLAEATGEDGFFEEAAKELARPGSARYAVLLVRPGATAAFRAARESCRKWRAPFGCEPVDDDWRLVFEPAGTSERR